VCWPGKSGGAIGFALIFLLLFLSRKKVNKDSRKGGGRKDKQCCCSSPAGTVCVLNQKFHFLRYRKFLITMIAAITAMVIMKPLSVDITTKVTTVKDYGFLIPVLRSVPGQQKINNLECDGWAPDIPIAIGTGQVVTNHQSYNDWQRQQHNG
jgi:hypothetical protein